MTILKPSNKSSAARGKVCSTGKVSTTTTTTLSKIRGFTIHLLFLIANRELTVSDLVDLTGKYPQYINRYLYNMRNYGFVEKRGPYWKLSEGGLSFFDHLKDLDMYSVTNNNNNNIIRKKKERRKKERRKIKQKTPKQLSIQPWLASSSLDETERVVVEVLADHYNQTASRVGTGGPYLLFTDIYDLAERFKVSPSLLPRALRKLAEEQIIYVWKNKKIGLKKAFLEKLEESSRL